MDIEEFLYHKTLTSRFPKFVANMIKNVIANTPPSMLCLLSKYVYIFPSLSVKSHIYSFISDFVFWEFHNYDKGKMKHKTFFCCFIISIKPKSHHINNYCCSVTNSCLTLQPPGLQNARLPYPLQSPRACSNSRALSQ